MFDSKSSPAQKYPRYLRSMAVYVLLLGALLIGATTSWANTLRRLVEFQPGTLADVQQQIITASGSTLVQLLPIVNAAAIALPANDPQTALTILLSYDEVVTIHEDPSIKAQSESPVEGMESSLIAPAPAPTAGSLWNLLQIGHGQVDPAIRGSGVEIAVVDTGIDPSHPTLAGVVIGGYNAVSGSGAGQAASGEGGDGEGGDSSTVGYSDCNGHGTHVAGIIAGSTTGVAPQAKLHAVRVLDCAGGGYVSDLISGLSWVYTQPQIRVVNMSLGFYKDGGYPLLRQAIEALHTAGVILVAAAGNYRYDCYEGDGDSKRFVINTLGCNTRVKFPARYPQTLTVAANTMDDLMAYYSIAGPEVDVMAPGGTLLNPVTSTTTTSSGGTGSDPAASGEGGDGEGGDGLYGGGSGTSMAAPHVAGVVALMLSVNPALTPLDVRAILEQTANDLGFTQSAQGHGRINAANAVATAATWTGVTGGADSTVIESDVTIDPSAILGQNLAIYRWATLNAKSQVMDNTTLDQHVTLGVNNSVGKDSRLKTRADVRTNVSIGHDTTIGRDTIIGAEGADMYGTMIGDHSFIDDDSVVGTNVKIGHYITVGTSVTIGDRTTVGDGTEIRNSVNVGNDVTIGSNVTIHNFAKVCDGEVIADGTVIPMLTTVGTCP